MPRSITYVAVLSGHSYLSCDAIFSSGKMLPALIMVDFDQYTAEHIGLLREIRARKPLIPMVALVPFGHKALKQTLRAMGGE